MIEAIRWNISRTTLETLDLPSYIRRFFSIQYLTRDTRHSQSRAKSVYWANSKAALAILSVLLLTATDLHAEIHRLSMGELVQEVV